MTSSKRRRENRWHQRKHHQQPPHGKVKSFEELAADPIGRQPAQE